MRREDHSHDSQHKEYQEEKKCDINVDAIFQIADEVLQTPPSSCVVRVVTPEKPGPVLVPSSVTCMLSDNPTSAMQGNPLHAGAESCIVDVVSYKHQEESVLSVPEQMPEDDIFEVSLYIVDCLKAFRYIHLQPRTPGRLGEATPAVCK